jgi:ACS family glucarate transporter-like MFS transporter
MTAAQRWTVGLMFALSVISYFERTILSVAAPSMMKEFALSPEAMGVVFTAFQLSYTLLMTPGGHLSDRFGPRNVLAAAALGAGLLTALVPFGGNPGLGALFGVVPALALLRFGLGAFTAPLYPSLGHMNAVTMPPGRQARVFGIVNAGAGLGGAISPLLFSMMMGRLGWRVSFGLAGAVAMGLALVWWRTVPDQRGARPEGGRAAWRELLADRNLRWLILGYGAVDYFQYIFFFWLYYYLGEVRQLPPGETAFYATMPFAAWALMMPVGGWAAGRLSAAYGVKTGLRTVAIASLALASLCLVAAPGVTETNALVALLSLALGFAASADVPFWSAAVNLGGRRAGAAGGLMNTGGNLGGSIAPLLTPLVAARFGWSAGLYLGAAVAVLGILAWTRIDPAPREGE